MAKRYSQVKNAQEWLSRVRHIRGQKDVVLLENALQLYGTVDSQAPLMKGINIADILLLLGLDSETLAAAIVYPGLQAEQVHLDHVLDALGESCRKLLHDALQMQSLGKFHIQVRGQHHTENLRKMLLAMVTDIRAVLIVLGERIWELHQVKQDPPEVQKQLAQETLAVFAPLANRLGIWQLKWEIEDLCLRYLEPQTYSKIAQWLASRREEREAYIQRMIDSVSTILTRAQIPDFQVTGRVKHIYSIYRKMARKSAAFNEIFDVSAIRILVPDIPDCYRVLSLLQDHWQHIPEEFDDYISQPKANGYRSIHTVVIGPLDHYVEIQIRTQQMHIESEQGMAAHWQYKEGVLQPSNYEAKIALLRQMIDWQKEVVGADSQSVAKIQDIFADRVYVFTPTGDIMDLPKGATPLDFAYHIHSEVGHRCRGAKINGSIVTLTTTLQTGDRVEVLTAKQANPSRDWLNPHLHFLKTPRARARLAHYFRLRDGIQTAIAGRELLEKELKKIGHTDKVDLQALTAKFHFKSVDDFLCALVTGELRLVHVMNFLRPTVAPLLNTVVPVRHEAGPKNVQILGVNNLLTQMARCCKPLPGDPIVGYVTRNRGVSVHRRDCSNLVHTLGQNERRMIEVNWGDETVSTYPVDVQIRVFDRSGLLRDITAVLAAEKINVLGLQTQAPSSANSVDIYVTLEIANREQLKKAILVLQSVPSVLQASRR